MTARSTPSRRWATSITGAMQFVVQLAQEMIRGLPCGSVDAVHHGRDSLRTRRRGQDHVRRAGLNMLRQVVLGPEHPGALQHQVDAELVPRQVRRITLGERRDPAAVDDQRARRGADVAVVAPVDGVVPDQVRQVVRVGDVVDRDEVEPVGVEQDLQRRPTDPAQPVDRHGRHVSSRPRLDSQLCGRAAFAVALPFRETLSLGVSRQLRRLRQGAPGRGPRIDAARGPHRPGREVKRDGRDHASRLESKGASPPACGVVVRQPVPAALDDRLDRNDGRGATQRIWGPSCRARCRCRRPRLPPESCTPGGVLRLTGLPPANRFPDAVLGQDDESHLELRFGGAGDTRTVEIPLWTLEGQDVEAAQLWLLAELRQRGYRVTLER